MLIDAEQQGAALAARAVTRLTGVEVVTQCRTDTPAVALTLDDGPHPGTTPALLDVLARHAATASFFVMGSPGRRHPDLLERISAAGHELGNHLMDDRPSVLLPPAEFTRQLHEVDLLLSPFGPIRFFRPGSGWFTPRMLRAGARLGYRCALGSPRLAVASYPQPARLARRMARACRPGSVVVLHEGGRARERVAEVADVLLGELATQGLRACSLATLTP